MNPISVDKLKEIEASSRRFLNNFKIQSKTKTGQSYKSYAKDNGINLNAPKGNLIQTTEPIQNASERVYYQVRKFDLDEWINLERISIGTNNTNYNNDQIDIAEISIRDKENEVHYSNAQREIEAEEIVHYAKYGSFEEPDLDKYKLKFRSNTITDEEKTRSVRNNIANSKNEYVEKMLALYTAAKQANEGRSIFSKIFNWGLNKRISKALTNIEKSLTESDPQIFTTEEFQKVTSVLLDKDQNKYNNMKGLNSDGDISKSKKTFVDKRDEQRLAAENKKLSYQLYKEFQTNDHKKIIDIIDKNPVHARERIENVEKQVEIANGINNGPKIE